MMLHFQGREDELIETLRTMQERNIALRSQAAVEKSAHKKMSYQDDSPGSSPGSQSQSTVSDLGGGPSHLGSQASSQSLQESLAMAIGRGDWPFVRIGRSLRLR